MSGILSRLFKRDGNLPAAGGSGGREPSPFPPDLTGSRAVRFKEHVLALAANVRSRVRALSNRDKILVIAGLVFLAVFLSLFIKIQILNDKPAADGVVPSGSGQAAVAHPAHDCANIGRQPSGPAKSSIDSVFGGISDGSMSKNLDNPGMQVAANIFAFFASIAKGAAILVVLIMMCWWGGLFDFSKSRNKSPASPGLFGAGSESDRAKSGKQFMRIWQNIGGLAAGETMDDRNPDMKAIPRFCRITKFEPPELAGDVKVTLQPSGVEIPCRKYVSRMCTQIGEFSVSRLVILSIALDSGKVAAVEIQDADDMTVK